MVEVKFVLFSSFSTHFHSLACVRSYIAFNVKNFLILAPHLVSDSLILGTVLV